MYNEEAGSAQACHPSLAGQIHITCRLWDVMGMSGSENRSERLFAEDDCIVTTALFSTISLPRRSFVFARKGSSSSGRNHENTSACLGGIFRN